MKQGQQTQDLVCFDNFEQIRELKGYRPENPLTVENYSRILGWYQFPQKCECCVRRESGSLCRTLHNNGWVARLQDGSVTILGRNCANDKFGADSSVFKDISLAINTIKARQRAERLRDLLSRRDEFEGRLIESRARLMAARRKIDAFLGEIGPKFTARIVAMARAGNASVVVEAVRERHYEENGQTKKELSSFKHRLGNLDGISALNNDQYIQLSIAISNIVQAFTGAADIQSLTRATQAALTTRLEECEPVLQRVAAVEVQLEKILPKLSLAFLLYHRRTRRAKQAGAAGHASSRSRRRSRRGEGVAAGPRAGAYSTAGRASDPDSGRIAGKSTATGRSNIGSRQSCFFFRASENSGMLIEVGPITDADGLIALPFSLARIRPSNGMSSFNRGDVRSDLGTPSRRFNAIGAVHARARLFSICHVVFPGKVVVP